MTIMEHQATLQEVRRYLGSPLPHLHRDWARCCRICTGTWLACRITA